MEAEQIIARYLLTGAALWVVVFVISRFASKEHRDEWAEVDAFLTVMILWPLALVMWAVDFMCALVKRKRKRRT